MASTKRIQDKMTGFVCKDICQKAKAQIIEALLNKKEPKLEIIITDFTKSDSLEPLIVYNSYVSGITYYAVFNPLNLFEKPKAKRGEEGVGYISIKISKIEDIMIMYKGEEI